MKRMPRTRSCVKPIGSCELSLRSKGTAISGSVHDDTIKMFTCDSFPLKRVKAVKYKNSLIKAGAFDRIARMEHIRNVIDEDMENDLDTVIETVMYEDYKSKMNSSSTYHLCHREPQHCYSVHGKHLEICHPFQSTLNCYCRIMMFECAAEYLNSFLIGHEYPTPVIILHLLHFILNGVEVAAVVKTVHVLTHFITTHPPYEHELQEYYIDLLTTDCGHEFANTKRSGFLQNVISLLKEVNDNTVSTVKEENAEGSDYNYKALPREDKLQRLTWVLEWIAHVFEVDLINFLAKHQDDPSEYMKNEPPLIVAVLQKIANVNDCCIICLIEVWVRANVLQLPLSFLQNLMKIIKLIAEAAFLCDFSLGPYPNFGPHCDALAQHIVHALSDLKTEDTVQAIHAIDPQWLGFRVAYLMTCKEVKWMPSQTITIQNLINLCCYVLGGTVIEDANEEEIRPSLMIQGRSEIKSPGTQHISETNELGDTRLKTACSMDDTKSVLKLLRQADVDVNVADSDGWTALHEAVVNGSVHCIRALLSHKGTKQINVHAKNIEGITPLMCAVMENKLEVAKLLLRYGGVSILYDKNLHGKTAIELATSADMQKLLSDYAEEFSSDVCVSHFAISLAKLLIPFYISVYRIQHIFKRQFQEAVKSSPLVLDLVSFKKETANLKILKYALEKLPYLADYGYLLNALSNCRPTH